MTLVLWLKLATLILVPVLFVVCLHRSASIGFVSRRLLDADVWRTPRPLLVLVMLFILPLSLILSNWGVEFDRGDLVFLAYAASSFVAMLVAWVLAHSCTAINRPGVVILISLTVLFVLAWIMTDMAISRIGLAKR